MKQLFKKIFHGLDMRWNRIINVRTDMGDEAYQNSETVTNKGYVEQMTTYDTQTAIEFGCDTVKYPDRTPNRSPFWWMRDMITYNKSWKAIIDQLVHPNIKPVYLNPELSALRLDVSTLVSTTQSYKPQHTDKPVLPQNIGYDCDIYIDFTQTKRKLQDSYKHVLKLTYQSKIGNTLTEQEFVLEQTYTNDSLHYKCSLKNAPIASIESAVVELTFAPIEKTDDNIEQDTHFVDYVPEEFFVTNYKFTEDVTEQLRNQFIGYAPVLWLQNNGTQHVMNDSYKSYTEISNILMSESVVVQSGNDVMNSWDVLVPEDMWKDYFVSFDFYTAEKSPYGAFGRVFIKQQDLLFDTAEAGVTYNTPKIVTIGGVRYVHLNAPIGMLYGPQYPNNFRMRLVFESKYHI